MGKPHGRNRGGACTQACNSTQSDPTPPPPLNSRNFLALEARAVVPESELAILCFSIYLLYIIYIFYIVQ